MKPGDDTTASAARAEAFTRASSWFARKVDEQRECGSGDAGGCAGSPSSAFGHHDAGRGRLRRCPTDSHERRLPVASRRRSLDRGPAFAQNANTWEYKSDKKLARSYSKANFSPEISILSGRTARAVPHGRGKLATCYDHYLPAGREATRRDTIEVPGRPGCEGFRYKSRTTAAAVRKRRSATLAQSLFATASACQAVAAARVTRPPSPSPHLFARRRPSASVHVERSLSRPRSPPPAPLVRSPSRRCASRIGMP